MATTDRKRTTYGFTLIELLIVIVVIAILATIALVAYNGIQAQARDAQRAAAVAAYRRGLELYKIDTGSYPTPCQNVNADCAISDLNSYLTPTYISSVSSSVYVGNFFSNGDNYATTYTILILYESKSPCKVGVNPSSSYYSQYPFC